MTKSLRSAIDQLRPEFVKADLRISALACAIGAPTYIRTVPNDLLAWYIVPMLQLRRTYGPETFAIARAEFNSLFAARGRTVEGCDNTDIEWLCKMISLYRDLDPFARECIEAAYIKMRGDSELIKAYQGFPFPTATKFAAGSGPVAHRVSREDELYGIVPVCTLPCQLVVCYMITGNTYVLYLLDTVTKCRVPLDLPNNTSYLLIDDYGCIF